MCFLLRLQHIYNMSPYVDHKVLFPSGNCTDEKDERYQTYETYIPTVGNEITMLPMLNHFTDVQRYFETQPSYSYDYSSCFVSPVTLPYSNYSLNNAQLWVDNQALWNQFNLYGNEMIITKPGRYILKFCFHRKFLQSLSCKGFLLINLMGFPPIGNQSV